MMNERAPLAAHAVKLAAHVVLAFAWLLLCVACTTHGLSLSVSNGGGGSGGGGSGGGGLNRRTAIQQGAYDLFALSTATALVESSSVNFAWCAQQEQQGATDKNFAVPKDKAVLVLGANGGTGQECVAAALAAGRPCVAATRSGTFVGLDTTSTGDEKPDPRLSVIVADVTSLESVCAAIKGTPNLGAVVFAASVGSNGGDAFDVDKNGVLKVAQCCIQENIPRFVVVSSGAVTKPSSAIYLLLNTVGKGIMEAKVQGEDGVRAMYAAPSARDKKLGYTIIRPGGLTKEPGLGAGALELNQGDDKSGRISRADVASLCIKCLDSPDSWDTTFECYETLTAKPLEAVGLSNIFKSKDPTTVMTGRERRGETWDVLFQGLARD
jgi:nucleoside-diphosphate-sugar epimerase